MSRKRFFKYLSPAQKEKYSMAARARRSGVSVVMQFTKSEVVNRDGLTCYLCGKSLTNETATIDHVIPLKKGGFHCLSNAKIACKPCNSKKGSKDLEDYLNEGM